MTKSLARELGRSGIRVNAVAPGVTRTDMVAALPAEIVERISAPIPLGRIGEPEEVKCVSVPRKRHFQLCHWNRDLSGRSRSDLMTSRSA